VKSETAIAQVERVMMRCGRFLVPLFLCLASALSWAQRLNVSELDTTAGRTFHFQNYTGPQAVVETIRQISGIGEVLSRNLRAGGTRGDYFGKYTVIRAYQPAETSLLSADLIVLGPRSTIDDIRNVQRIVAGYLAAEFGYDAKQAARLSVLVTTYNAAHRGDIATLSKKYTPLVMSYLTAENAGIALSYADWPGKTRLIVPLGVAAASQTAGGKAGGAPIGPGGPAVTAPGGSAAPVAPGPAPGSAGPAVSGAGPAGTGGGAASGGGAAGGPPQPGGAASAPGAARGSGAASPSTGQPVTGGQGGPSPGAPGTSPAPAGNAPAGASTTGTSPAATPTPPTPPTPPAGTPTPGAERPRGTPVLFGIALWRWLLVLAALVLLALVVFLLVRLVRRLATPSYERELARSIREGHPLVEMVVIPQNRHIGNRNIHYVKPGGTASVGSGSATFLIYFVPVPRRMAQLIYDGSAYSFIPLKTELFPGLSGPVADCLGKGIPARSTRGYRFTIVFHRFVPPLEEINRLMRSTRAGSPRRIPPQP
jgi:hypothetical protein